MPASALLWIPGTQPCQRYYGGTTFDCAAMETIFHDPSFAAGLETHDKRKLAGQAYSQVTSRRDLSFVNLSATALLGIQRNQLIDTEKDQHTGTRAWAAAINAQCPSAQGGVVTLSTVERSLVAGSLPRESRPYGSRQPLLNHYITGLVKLRTDEMGQLV